MTTERDCDPREDCPWKCRTGDPHCLCLAAAKRRARCVCGFVHDYGHDVCEQAAGLRDPQPARLAGEP